MFKKILSVVTIVLVVVIAYVAFKETVEVDGVVMTMGEATLYSIGQLNIWVLFLLIPVQISTYYCAGQIYFAFLRARQGLQITQMKLMRVSLEINFVNHAMPSGGVSGLGYLIWRLRSFGITPGQVSFIHVLRYMISGFAKTVQIWIALVIVLVAGVVIPGGEWAIWVAVGVALGVELVILVAWLIVRNRKTVEGFAQWVSKATNWLVRWLTRGRKRVLLREESVGNYFSDLRGDYLAIKRNKDMLKKPILWGALFVLLEAITYWVVAIAMGRPEILPQIMIAEGVASFVGLVLITPGGVGGYEALMIGMMVALGVDLSTATVVVITTRVIVMLGTFVSGWGFYQQALLSHEDKFDPKSKEDS